MHDARRPGLTWDSGFALSSIRSLATYALTQLLRRWSRKSVGPRRCIQWSVRPRRWLVDLAASLLPGGAAIGEALTSAMEDEHLDLADRGHGRLARLVGQQAVSLEHGLVQAGRAADLSLYDDEEGVAGLALLDQHGAVLERLRFECLGDVTPLEEGHLCAPNGKRSLRQRLIFEANELTLYLGQLGNRLRCRGAQIIVS